MIAPDVNVLLYALREESERHGAYRSWLEAALAGVERLVLFEPVLAAVLRISTHPAIYRTPTPRAIAERFVDASATAPAAVRLSSGDGHWETFRRLVREADCRGNAVQDAYLAALALEHGCTWVTADRGFARFPGLSWKHPLDSRGKTRNPVSR